MSGNSSARRQNVPAARILRGQETPAEHLLWDALRGRQLAGLKFRRQHPIGPFDADFCCPEQRLIVELDGEIHETQQDRDAEREDLLRAAGYHILRFTNREVLTDLSGSLTRIQFTADSLALRQAYPVARTQGWWPHFQPLP